MILFGDEPAAGDYRVEALATPGPRSARCSAATRPCAARCARRNSSTCSLRAAPAGWLRGDHAADRRRAVGPDRGRQLRCRTLQQQDGHPVPVTYCRGDRPPVVAPAPGPARDQVVTAAPSPGEPVPQPTQQLRTGSSHRAIPRSTCAMCVSSRRHTLNSYRARPPDVAALLHRTGPDQPGDICRGGHPRVGKPAAPPGLAGSSIQRSLSAARSFFNFLGRESGRPRNPAASVQAPRKPRKLPKTLDADQVDKYLSFQEDSLTARRDRAMAELFYSSGLRLAELAAVDIDDIDPHSRLLTVTGKGNKTRTVPVGSVALEAIARWLEVRPPAAADARRRRRPVHQQSRPAHQRAQYPGAPESAGPQVRHAPGRAPPYAAPLLCQPHAGIQRRPAGGPGTAGARQYLHHADLYPSGFPAPGQGLRRGPSQGQTPRQG